MLRRDHFYAKAPENIFTDVPGCAPRHIRSYPIKISFKQINKRALAFADHIEKNFSKIHDILIRYESHEVAIDEIARCLDLLRSLSENKNYFNKKIGQVVAFLPRNQPLYAFCCFAVVPALMSSKVQVKPPSAVHFFFFDLVKALRVKHFFSNIFISTKLREDFLREVSAVNFYPKTGESIPVTDAVIFTGTMENADKVRRTFDTDVLFIANGAGHNPIVISKDANLHKAVQSVLRIQLYNQGQDCANANSILVHSKIYTDFLKLLKFELSKTKIGPYSNPDNRVGPLSEIKSLIDVREVFVENVQWIEKATPGNIRTKENIVEPTIIARPLNKGGNFHETFAPIFFVQKYKDDSELSKYFEDPRYARNAMYVTVFGASNYVDNLVSMKYGDGKILHTEKTIVKNTDLHAPGIERGTQQYGGFGRGASCLSLHGIVYAKPTLPQRDIYERLVEPNLKNKLPSRGRKTEIVSKVTAPTKNPETEKVSQDVESDLFLDYTPQEVADSFIKLDKKKIFSFLNKPNYFYIKQLTEGEINDIKEFLKLVQQQNFSLQDLETRIFLIARPLLEKPIVKIDQKNFFKNVYQLLLGRDSGPRLAKLVFYSDKKKIIQLLRPAIEK